MSLQQKIEEAWENRELLKQADYQEAVRSVIRELDLGKIRVAEPVSDGWQVNEWVKKAVVMYFPIQQMKTIEVGPFEFHDKIPLKKNYAEKGVRVEKEAVLGANVVLTASTKIIDVTGNEPVELKGRVPARSVVIPGSYTKKFPAGEYQVPCALIIGKRKESTDKKTSLNDALRENNVSV